MTFPLIYNKPHAMIVSFAWIIFCGFILCGGSANAQDSTSQLGGALVDRAAHTETVSAPLVPPPPPTGMVEIPSSTPAPMSFTPESLNPIIAKVDADAKEELKKLLSQKGGGPSVLFSSSEQRVLAEAIAIFESGNFIKPVAPEEVAPVPSETVELDVGKDRNLTLAGISYGDGKNWVVWLNKQRLTPTRLPPQVRDIKVYRHYVEIRWLDDETKETISVRLRPNQRFNLDTQTFLPG